MRRSKGYTARAEQYDREQIYSLDEAIAILKKFPTMKFDETVETTMRLGVDPRQSDQNVRGALSLPHGTGKQVTVVVVATGDAAEQAKTAGADHVGFEDLIERIKGGWLEFDTMIATPAAMQKVRTLGRLLGPRGLMPNPKTGTVTENTGEAVAAAKAGRVEFRADRTGCVHVPVGKISFTETALAENSNAVIQAIIRSRPPATKGIYVLSCTLSTTMSPGVKVSTREMART